jgi:hypothetical protein
MKKKLSHGGDCGSETNSNVPYGHYITIINTLDLDDIKYSGFTNLLGYNLSCGFVCFFKIS